MKIILTSLSFHLNLNMDNLLCGIKLAFRAKISDKFFFQSVLMSKKISFATTGQVEFLMKLYTISCQNIGAYLTKTYTWRVNLIQKTILVYILRLKNVTPKKSLNVHPLMKRYYTFLKMSLWCILSFRSILKTKLIHFKLSVAIYSFKEIFNKYFH